MNHLLLTQIMMYDLIDVLFCTFIVLTPFRSCLCSRRRLFGLTLTLYGLVVLSRVLVQIGLLSVGAVSVMRIFVYVLTLCLAVRSSYPKRLFVLIVVLNYTSFLMILYQFAAFKFYPREYGMNPYSFRFSILLAAVFAFFFPLIYWLMNRKIQPLIHSSVHKKMWRYLWLTPSTFCVIFHYSVLKDHGGTAFSGYWYNVVFAAVINAGSLLVTYMVVMLVNEGNANLELKAENYHLAMQTLQYETLKNRMEETRVARHDLRHNMTLIKSYLEDGRYEELKHYIIRYMSALSLDSPVIYCDNHVLNTVLAYYGGSAGTYGYEFKADVMYPGSASLSDMDITVLLGNLLENAAEACARQTNGHRFIHVWFKQEQTAILIAVDNSCDGTVRPCDDGFISSKSGDTGTGVISIKKIAKKYHGLATFDYGDGKFSATIMLYP